MLENAKEDLINSIQLGRTVRNLELKALGLQNTELKGLRAEGLRLEDCDLRGASLGAVKWRSCVLHDVRMDGVDCTGAVMRMCSFEYVRARRAVLTRAVLENSCARGSNFDEADFAGAKLTDSDFSRSSFRGSNLEHVNAAGIDLRGADLRSARLQGAYLVDADLRGADLTDADLTGADLRGADTRGALGVTEERAQAPEGDSSQSRQGALETMLPIAEQLLRTGGSEVPLDPGILESLIETVEGVGSDIGEGLNGGAPMENVMAVVRFLQGGGEDTISNLMGVLSGPEENDPSEAAKILIRGLSSELGMGAHTPPEEILARLMGRGPESNGEDRGFRD